jgi:hypothetical protein
MPIGEISPALGLLSGFDLALIELATPLEDRDPIGLFSGDPFDREATFVGYGATGLGSQGQNGGADNTRRAATNITDFAVTIDGEVVPNLFAADYDEAGDGDGDDGLPDEGGVLFGDSGGPILLQTPNDWLLFGVATAVARTDPSVAFGGFGSFSIWTGIATPEALAFVTNGTGAQVVPLPPALALLLGGLGALAAVGRRSLRAG